MRVLSSNFKAALPIHGRYGWRDGNVWPQSNAGVFAKSRRSIGMQLGGGGLVGHFALTIIVPAFNEAARLPVSLPVLASSVQDIAHRLGPVEIVIVDDGSRDDTCGVALRHCSLFSHARVIRLPWNCGKGAAVRAGMMAAGGRVVVFVDADLSADLRHLPLMIRRLDGADVVIGSRRADGAMVAGRTRARELGGIAYNRLAKRLTGIAFEDTQCGFKAFRADAGKMLFSICRSSGFGFDVEVCAAAVAMGLRVVEVPISWSAADGGTLRLRSHAAGMLADLLRARKHRRRSRRTGTSVVVAPCAGQLPVDPPQQQAGSATSHPRPDAVAASGSSGGRAGNVAMRTATKA